MNAIDLAIQAAGSQEQLGKLVGRGQTTIHYWQKKGRCPAEAVLAIEKATGISRHDLRPDLYPREEVA